MEIKRETLKYCAICGDYKKPAVTLKYKGRAYRYYCEDCLRENKWMYHDYMQKVTAGSL